MNTTVYLDKLDIVNMNKIHTNYLSILRKRLKDSGNLAEYKLNMVAPVKDKVMVGLLLDLDSWKKLNHWIIDNTTEMFKPSMRDAILSVLEGSE